MVAYYTQSVIPGLPRDLFKKAVMSTQPPLDVSKIPDIAGGDSGTTDGLIRPYSVIPGLPRDLGSFRDLCLTRDHSLQLITFEQILCSCTHLVPDEILSSI